MVEGCTTAGIGCIQCKQPVIDGVLAEQKTDVRTRPAFPRRPDLVRNLVADGCERARELARETMRDVREAMGLAYD